jgi:formimidoylglutamate deiminase
MAETLRYHPELLFWEGRLQAGLALEVRADGTVAGASPSQEGDGAIALPHRALLPGLVNGHSHAFQRLIRGRTEYVAKGQASDDFWSWREWMYRAAGALQPEDVFVASRQAFLEMVLGGITAVGEFHYLHHNPDGTPYVDRDELAKQVLRAAKEVGLRIALLRVGYARAGFQVEENPRQRRFIDASFEPFARSVESLRAHVGDDPFVRIGAAPHSVRALPKAWLARLPELGELPLHMHVAEQPAELAACVAEHGRRPVELLSDLGLLHERFTAVHAVHLSPHEVAALRHATVCACPSTERNLGDGVVAADALLAAGARLCLGTDSHAGIDLLDEARQLESHLRLVRLRRAVLDPGEGDPSGLAARLLRIASDGGAHALGFAPSLQPNGPADFFTVDLHHPSMAGASGDSVLGAVMFGAEKGAVREVAVAGQLRVRDGHHPLEETSRSAFTALARRIFS